MGVPMRARSLVAAAAVSSLLVPALASALDPAIKCQAAKLKLSGKYASCRLIEDAAALKAGRAPDHSTCDTKLREAWAKIETSLGTECPTSGDLTDVQDSLVECIPTTRYLVRVGVVSTHTFGAIQIDTDYSAAHGGFVGEGASVSCTSSLPGQLAAYNDKDAEEILQDGHIGLSNFSSPVELSQCIFESNSIIPPHAGDFVPNVVDATDPNGNPIPGVVAGIVIEKIP